MAYGKDLEAQVRDFAIAEHDIYVVTGPVLPKTKTITIGSNKVTVPTHYYKVVYDRTPPEKMIGFILPNDGSDKPDVPESPSLNAGKPLLQKLLLQFLHRMPTEMKITRERPKTHMHLQRLRRTFTCVMALAAFTFRIPRSADCRIGAADLAAEGFGGE